MNSYSGEQIEASTDTVIIASLADGLFSRVYLCKSRSIASGSICPYKAIKVYPREKVAARSHRIMAEKSNLQKIALSNSPYIVRLIGTEKDDKYLYIIMEAYHCGHMNLHIHDSLKFSPLIARNYAAEIISALFSLSKCGVIHRDIKPKNLIIDLKGHIKLCDFGSSKNFFPLGVDDVINSDRNTYSERCSDPISSPNTLAKTYTIIGTAQYMAPEIIAKCGYSVHVDWWALGVMLFEMLCGAIPVFRGVPVWGRDAIIGAVEGSWPDEETSSTALTATQKTQKTQKEIRKDSICQQPSHDNLQNSSSSSEDSKEHSEDYSNDFSECSDAWSIILTEDNIATLSSSFLSRSGWNLIKQLLSPNPDDRIGPWTLPGIKEHSFFEGIQWGNIDNGVSPPADSAFNRALGFLDFVEESDGIISDEALTAGNNPFEGF